jgi:nucleoside-diphosphate-sugar epimerase
MLGVHVSDGRLAFFDGDVASQRSWDELSRRHGTEFTHVVAGAALTPTPEEEQRLAAKIVEVNYRGVLLCIEWARTTCSTLVRFVHISSDAVLGVPGLVTDGPPAGDVGVHSGAPPHPTDWMPAGQATLPGMSVYAVAKVAGEATVRRWRELYGMDAVSVRFSDV